MKSAAKLHERVPPDWYHASIKRNVIQRYVHSRRFAEVGDLIEPTGGKILDIGSADGVFTNVVLRRSKADKVIGIDVLKSSVDWANKHWRSKRLEFRVGDAHKLKFGSGYFDAVVALEVLEHVYQPMVVLKEIKRVLKKGGYAVFLVPAETLLFRTIWYFWKNYYVGRIWQDTHLHAYSDSYLVKLAKEVGFKIEEEKKVIFGCLHLIKVRNE